MKVKVSYPVVHYTEIEIPNELAKKYEDAREKDDDVAIDSAYDRVNEYIADAIMKEDIEAECLDWWDWEEID